MSFNHYAKIKRILEDVAPGWYIAQIDSPTTVQSFSGERVTFPHYFRIYTKDHQPVKYGKFQQIDRLAKILNTSVADLPRGRCPQLEMK